MSTAIMPQNAMYEFGDNYVKSGGGDSHHSHNHNHNHHHHHHTVRAALSRMASAPGGGALPGDGGRQLAALLGNLTQRAAAAAAAVAAPAAAHRRLERTHSAPAPQQQAAANAQAQGAASAVNTSRYKTELCRPYEEFGVCKYGDKCQFAHGINELRSLARHPKYKTELCRTYHTVGFCPYGPRCHFVHNQDEVMQKAPPSGILTSRQSAPLPMSAPLTSATTRQRPAALSPALSLESSGSPAGSLSQSPTSSLGSFFSSEPELHSPDDQRLPVFNRLSAAQMLSLTDLLSLR